MSCRCLTSGIVRLRYFRLLCYSIKNSYGKLAARASAIATAQKTNSEFLLKFGQQQKQLYDEAQPEKQTEANKAMVEQLQQLQQHVIWAAPSVQVPQGEERDDQPPLLEPATDDDIFDNHQQHDGHDEGDDEDDPDDEENFTLPQSQKNVFEEKSIEEMVKILNDIHKVQ